MELRCCNELPKEHELHQRRKGRNLGLGLVLVAFVAIVFGLTVVKVSVIFQVLSRGGRTMSAIDPRKRQPCRP